MDFEGNSPIHWVPLIIVALAALVVAVGALVVQYRESKIKDEITFYYKERAMVAGIVGTMVTGWGVLLVLFYHVYGWERWNILWLAVLVAVASFFIGLMIAPFLRRIFYVLSDRWEWPD
ncbi:MAG: hypothetical protein V3T80_10545 [Kiloniellales bacterium]